MQLSICQSVAKVVLQHQGSQRFSLSLHSLFLLCNLYYTLALQIWFFESLIPTPCVYHCSTAIATWRVRGFTVRPSTLSDPHKQAYDFPSRLSHRVFRISATHRCSVLLILKSENTVTNSYTVSKVNRKDACLKITVYRSVSLCRTSKLLQLSRF